MADETYLKTSCSSPMLMWSKVFPDHAIPKGLITDEELEGIIQYIKELK
jgi:hypothetical protein